MLQEHYHFREALVDELVRDLVGPVHNDEILTDPPITRYIMGVLYPQNLREFTPIEDHDSEDTPEDEEPGNDDPGVALANRHYPSSIGLTFSVDTRRADEITASVAAAVYRPDTAALEGNSRKPQAVQWRRHALPIVPVRLPLKSGSGGSTLRTSDGTALKLSLKWRIRRPDAAGIASVTVTLVNEHQLNERMARQRDAFAFFQTGISVSADEHAAVFFNRTLPQSAASADRDIRSYRLLYRNVRNFAIGHGCAVDWKPSADEPGFAVSLATTFTPSYEVPVAESRAVDNPALAMRFLATADRTAIVDQLTALTEDYAGWLQHQQLRSAMLSSDQRETAVQHLEDCRFALARMHVGIRLLAVDDVVFRAFTLMNRAMLMQRARAEWISNGKSTAQPELANHHAWRPFQLAFILLCLPGIVDPASDDRKLADLLWFPTGGGKTEAYLGLIGFTVTLRRLRNSDGGGVTAVMRYTLRLLTVQQFERALALICVLEDLRRNDRDLGAEPISIGLWVGRGTTPNTVADAQKVLDRLGNRSEVTEGNPVQVARCPWCGTSLDYRNYRADVKRARLTVSCNNRDCAFHSGLPVHLTDEEIYRARPTLLLATVDKFAALPRNGQTAALFNLATDTQRAQLPPELIIQDELHLISGPLGSLVGLYETAIDLLCSHNGTPPKIIASTATIRRADDQIHRLFSREVRQFPPPALDAADSYFSVEAPRERRGTRRYLGLMAAGSSHATLLVRAYSALLQRASELPGSDAIRDPYWTLVGYFNSLRVLGGARVQVNDDVEARMKLLAGAGREQRQIRNLVELTSRQPSSEIPNALQRMAVKLGSPQTPIDVLLATNMISVGVDVDRLSLMAVMGQPQTTAEYIQATSRVGRRHPGLVIVLYNAARSRDRSHYESFIAYHSALYRQVEPTSVTPFAPRARDRGLHAVLIALVRLLTPTLRDNKAAATAAFDQATLQQVRMMILQRVRATAPEQAELVDSELEQIIESWQTLAQRERELVYVNYKNELEGLLVDASRQDLRADDYFPTLNSLRDVDAQSRLKLITTRGPR